MSNYKYRDSRHTSTSLFPYALVGAASKLTSRTITITDRREIEVTEGKSAPSPLAIFGSLYPTPTARPDTTRKWQSEQTIEIEESYE